MAKFYTDMLREKPASRLQDPEVLYGGEQYPVGCHSFSRIRERNLLYVDKTEFVYKLTNTGLKSVFLSRPRRFGKSLLVSTLKSYFEGRKELFTGLAIERLEKRWRQFPVLQFDMSDGKGKDEDALNRWLISKIKVYEEEFGVKQSSDIDADVRLSNLIWKVRKKTGRDVVVLIDEYDAPMLEVIHDDEKFYKIRKVMRSFYAPLKSNDEYLEFVFMTGITKFSQLSIFSDLNNLINISMKEEFDAICGITEQEMLTQMSEEIDSLARRTGLSREETVRQVKIMYDGYHFTWPSPDIYNPFSLLNAFKWGRLNPYWFASGTPSYLINMLGKFDVVPSDIGEVIAIDEDFDAPTEQMKDIVPLFYQSGYLTIKGYYRGGYRLDIANREIMMGLYRSLLPNYAGHSTSVNLIIKQISDLLRHDRIDEALKGLQAFFSSLPYVTGANTEAYYQQQLITVLSACGIKARLEERTAHGRIDMVYDTNKKTYIMELKLGKSAEEALQQIKDGDYAARYAGFGYPVVKVGISFSGSTRTIDSWLIEE